MFIYLKRKNTYFKAVELCYFYVTLCFKSMFYIQPTCLSKDISSSKLTRNYELQRTGDLGFNKLQQTRCSHFGLKEQCKHKIEQFHFHSAKCHHTCSAVGWKTFGQGLDCQAKMRNFTGSCRACCQLLQSKTWKGGCRCMLVLKTYFGD